MTERARACIEKVMARFEEITPPKAEKRDFFHRKFQDSRFDPYHYMRKRGDLKVLSHLKAENTYAGRFFNRLQPLQEELFQEMKELIPKDYDTEPVKWGPWLYYQSWVRDREHLVYKRKKAGSGKPEILLDINKMAQDGNYCNVSGVWPSPRHDILAYALDREGREFYTIYFKDLKTGKNLSQSISKVTSDFVWANDNETVFYVRQDPTTLRAFQVFRFNIRTGADDLVWTETDNQFWLNLDRSLSGKHLFIVSSSSDTSEWRFLPADRPGENWSLFCERREKHRYFLDCGKDCFYILTNRDGAFNFKLMKTGVTKRAPSFWKEVIPHNESALIEWFSVFEEFISLEVRQKALRDILILDRGTEKIHKVPFPGEIYFCETRDNREYRTGSVRVVFNSPVHPLTVYDWHVRERRLAFLSQTPTGEGFSPKNYICKREFVTARDGAQIPLTLVCRKDMKYDLSAPLLIYGYGSYGSSVDPYFDTSVPPLLDRGFIYVLAHVRGGSEMGKKWYYEGRLLKKKNTFHDFIDCAEHLKKSNSRRRLYMKGASAGGLLTGAVLNERPELFHGAVAGVPFVDVLTTMLDDKIPLSTAEYEEWGNPNDQKYYNYIKSYSPYDNVKKTDYPHLFIRAGYHDPRVQYWEPAKWSARLREFKTNRTLLLLLTDMKTGHFGPTGRFQRLKTVARENSFFVYLERMAQKGKSLLAGEKAKNEKFASSSPDQNQG